MNSKRITLATAALVLLAGFTFAPSITKADTVTVVPPKFELIGNPGDTVSDQLKVENNGTTDQSYQVTVQDFKAQGDDGSIGLIDPTAPTTTYSLAKWITVEPSNLTIPAGQEKIINFSIHIPSTGEPGGHYASILVNRSGQATPGGASVNTTIGSLILLRVSGNVTENLSLDSFSTNSAFSQYGPVDFNMHFTNGGNVHVAPSGTIVITNTFNQKVAEIPVSADYNVLPGSSRLIQAVWNQKNLVGRYTASLVINYGSSKQTITATTTFIVFPAYLAYIGLGIILVIFLLITQRKSVKRFINRLTSD